jgi:hypothetical protein
MEKLLNVRRFYDAHNAISLRILLQLNKINSLKSKTKVGSTAGVISGLSPGTGKAGEDL